MRIYLAKHLVTADKREFIKISQAVGVGFVVMGAIGYLVKLGKSPSTCDHVSAFINLALPVHIPVNNILVA